MNVFLNSGGLQEHEDCISKIVQLGDFVYMSAQYGQGDTMVEQSITVCNAVLEALSEFGLRFDHLVKFTVYLTDLKNKEEFLSIFKNYIEVPFPAVTFIGVNELEHDAKVAVEGFGVNTLRHEMGQKESGCSGNCSDCQGHCE